MRQYILNNCSLHFIEAFPERDNPSKRVFEATKMSVSIMNLMKHRDVNMDFYLRTHGDRHIDRSKKKTIFNKDIIRLLDKNKYTIPLMSQEDVNLITKLYQMSIRIEDIGHCYTVEVDLTLDKQYISKNDSDATLLRGAGIGK